MRWVPNDSGAALQSVSFRPVLTQRDLLYVSTQEGAVSPPLPPREGSLGADVADVKGLRCRGITLVTGQHIGSYRRP